MYRGFKIIDADAHMQPPGDIWDRYTEAEFYDRRPLVHLWENKMFHHFAPCELYPEGTGPGRAGGGGGRKGKVLRPPKVTNQMHDKWGEAWEADFNVESRLKDMDTYGWDKMVCIPGGSQPLRLTGKDPALMAALARSWNNWAHDFCSADPSRLKMVGDLPNQHDIEGLVGEARRAVEELGAVTVMVPKPIDGHWWHDSYYDPFWAAGMEMGIPMSFHGVLSGDPHVGTRYQDQPGQFIALEHVMGFAFENMISMGHVIYSGILERFPHLRVSFLEGNAGWLPFWLGRLDDHAVEGRRQAVFFDAPPLKLKPSEYFYRQGFVACDGDEAAVKAAVDLCGDDNIVWNTDYPHPDAPDADKAIASLLDQPISDASKQKILWDNSVKLYGERMLA